MKRQFTLDVDEDLWTLFRGTCRARGIRMGTAFEVFLIDGLRNLGVQVDRSMFPSDDVHRSPRVVEKA